MAAEIPELPGRLTLHVLASMGPQLIGCGDDEKLTAAKQELSMLQWGRS